MPQSKQSHLDASDTERIAILHASLPDCPTRLLLAAWETFCYRGSRAMGYLMTDPERAMIWPTFASGFIALVRGGRSPLDAVDDFLAIAARMEGSGNGTAAPS